MNEPARAAPSLASRLAPLLWLLLGGLCCALVSGLEPNLLEEGIELHVAQRLAHGERLYRDVLVFTGPLPFELLALLFRGFGEEIGVARASVVVMHALASAAAFALARAARPGWAAHAAGAATATAPLLLFPLFGIYYYTTLAFQLSLLAGWAAWRGLDASRWLFVAGVLVAAVALCKQTIGLALAASLGLALLFAAGRERRLHALASFAGGGAATALLTLGLWAAHGTLADAIHGLVTLPASLDDSYRLPFLNLWPPGELSAAAAGSQTFYLPYFYILTQGLFVEPTPLAIGVTQCLFALPLLALLATAVRLTGRPAPPSLLLESALLVAWLVNLTPRTDWGHLVHVLPLAVAQLCVVTPRLRRAPGWRPVLSGALAAALLLTFAAGSVVAWRILDRAADPEPLSAHVPLRPVSATLRGPHIRSVIDFLERNARRGEPIFVARAEPLLYFATDTLNPTPYPGVFPAIREQQEQTILEALERVRFVVMSDVDQPAMTYYHDELPEVEAYLERYFRPAPPFADAQYHWLQVLERDGDRGAPLLDLVTLAPEARSFTRTADGRIEPAPPLDARLATRRNRRLLGFPLGPGGGGIEFEIEVPEASELQADASLGRAFSEAEVYGVPERSTIVVSVGQPGALTAVREITLGSGWSPAWIPFEADLAPWSGQRVTLRLELIRRPPSRPPRLPQIGYLGSPRIVRAAPAGESGARAVP